MAPRLKLWRHALDRDVRAVRVVVRAHDLDAGRLERRLECCGAAVDHLMTGAAVSARQLGGNRLRGRLAVGSLIPDCIRTPRDRQPTAATGLASEGSAREVRAARTVNGSADAIRIVAARGVAEVRTRELNVPTTPSSIGKSGDFSI